MVPAPPTTTTTRLLLEEEVDGDDDGGGGAKEPPAAPRTPARGFWFCTREARIPDIVRSENLKSEKKGWEKMK